MTFPTDAARVTSLDGSFVTNHVVNLPSGITAGSLVIVLIGFHDGATGLGIPAGWTSWPVDGGDPEPSGASVITPDARVVYRVCDGTEGSTITFTTSATRGASSIAWRIEGYDPDYIIEVVWDTATSGGTADPITNDPHGWEGPLDTLWLAGAVTRATSLSGTPTNYGNVAGSGPGGASVSTRGASRQLNAVSEDPDGFTKGSSTQHHIVCTIAIKPVDDEVVDHSPHDAGSGIKSRTTTNTNNHTAYLPPGQSGDRIIVGFALDSPSGQDATFPGGWTTFLGPLSNGNTRVVYAYRDADGTEGTSITVTTSGASTSSAAWAKRVRGYDAAVAPEGATATGTSTTADPPTLSPSWGSTSASLWIASGSMRVGTTRFIGGTPASYEKVSDTPSVRNVANATAIRAASRELTAASENPGAFGAHANLAWIAATIAVKGGSGGLPPAFSSVWID